MGLLVELSVEHEAWRALDELDALAARAIAAAVAASGLRVADGVEISVVLADDAFVQALNAQWRGKDRPTNVLSFPTEAAARAIALGDIVVAWETSASEAAEQGLPLADHLGHLLVHGTMHLLGFDHEDEDEADEMELREGIALRRLGIASPYEDPTRAVVP